MSEIEECDAAYQAWRNANPAQAAKTAARRDAWLWRNRRKGNLTPTEQEV